MPDISRAEVASPHSGGVFERSAHRCEGSVDGAAGLPTVSMGTKTTHMPVLRGAARSGVGVRVGDRPQGGVKPQSEAAWQDRTLVPRRSR